MKGLTSFLLFSLQHHVTHAIKKYIKHLDRRDDDDTKLFVGNITYGVLQK